MPVLAAAWTALCAALKSLKISAAVLISAGLVLSGVVGAEVFERTFRFSFLVFHFEGLGAQLADLKTRDAAALKAAQVHVATVMAAQTKATAAVLATYTPAVAAIDANASTLAKEIPAYVTPKDDAACTLNPGAVRLLDAAAGGLPAAPGADDAPSGVALSTLVTTDVGNDAAALENADQLAALQAWVRAQQAAQDASGTASSAPADADAGR